MHPSPPALMEKIVSLFIPAASREEVLGDLHERYASSGQYVLEALQVIPMVVLSRIRRTADPQVLLMEAAILYLSYVGAAWLQDSTSLSEEFGLMKPAIPPVMILFGQMVEEAYADPRKQSALRFFRGPLLGLGFAYLSQWALATESRRLALPPWTMLYGSVLTLLLAVAVKALFPPLMDRPLGANGPALRLKQTAGPVRTASKTVQGLKRLGLIALAALTGACMAALLLVILEWKGKY